MSSQQNRGPATKKMKLEHETTPATPQPAPTYSTTQWGSAQIPIDPVLQQQTQQQQQQQAQQQAPQQHPVLSYPHYQPYGQTSHYAQAAYTTHPHYQQYQAAQQSAQAAASRQAPTEGDATDIATLNDALGSAGVDLRAEEETLQRSHDHHQPYRAQEDRARRQPPAPAFDARVLGATLRDIGAQHKVGRVPEDAVTYLALALRARLQGLVRAMAAAAAHRTDAQFDRPPGVYEDGAPMWSVVVRRDARKQLEALEKVEREEEMKVRRERKDRADAAAAHAAAAAAHAAGAGASDGMGIDDPMDGTPTKKPKKKKDGPGVTARNMSEDVQKRLSNAVATQAAGLGRGKYAWMNAGSLANSTPKSKPTPAGTPPATTSAPTTTTPQASAGPSGSWAKPYVSTVTKQGTSPVVEEDTRRTITMRDALFVIERERGHGAGRGAARGWV